MSNVELEIIHQIIAAGGAAELHRMLLGMSRYNLPGIVPPKPKDAHEALLETLAVHHLEFVACYGLGVSEAIGSKGYVEIAHAGEFEEWLARGAPGLAWEDVLAYLKDRPLPQGPSAASLGIGRSSP